MAYLEPGEVNKQIAAALGLDPNQTRGIQITIEPGKYPQVMVRDINPAQSAGAYTRSFELKPEIPDQLTIDNIPDYNKMNPPHHTWVVGELVKIGPLATGKWEVYEVKSLTSLGSPDWKRREDLEVN